MNTAKRTLFAIMLVLLAANMLVAQIALGEGVAIGGSVEVGFGIVKSEMPDTSSPEGVGEATVNFEAKKDSFTGRIEITIAETNEELNTAEHEVVWSPSESVSIIVSGHSFGIEPVDGNISVVNAPGGPVGDEEAFIDFSDTGILNVEFNLAKHVFGMAIIDACVPECGYGLDAAGESIFPNSELGTFVAHLRGSMGAFAYNAYAAQSSGTFADTQTVGDGSGAGLGLVLESGAFRMALDYAQITIECSAAASTPACVDDNEQALWGIALNLGGFGAHYFFAEDETGADTEETSNIDIVFLIEAGDATVGPEFRTTTVKAVDGTETTESFTLFGMSVEF